MSQECVSRNRICAWETLCHILCQAPVPKVIFFFLFFYFSVYRNLFLESQWRSVGWKEGDAVDVHMKTALDTMNIINFIGRNSGLSSRPDTGGLQLFSLSSCRSRCRLIFYSWCEHKIRRIRMKLSSSHNVGDELPLFACDGGCEFGWLCNGNACQFWLRLWSRIGGVFGIIYLISFHLQL